MTFIFSLDETWQHAFAHLSTPPFWLLGGYLILNGRWVNQQLERFTELENQLYEPDGTPIKGNGPLIMMVPTWFWLLPHISTQLRRAVVVFLALCVFPLQLIEGWWALNTIWRVATAAVNFWWNNVDFPFLFRGIQCLACPWFAIFCSIKLGRAVFFLIKVQFWYVRYMWIINPGPFPEKMEINEALMLRQSARNKRFIAENDLENRGSQDADAKAP